MVTIIWPYKDPEKEKQSKYKYWLKHKDKYDKQRKGTPMEK